MDQNNFSIRTDYSNVDNVNKLDWYLSTFPVENLNFVDVDKTQIFRIAKADDMRMNPFTIHVQNLILVYTSLQNSEIESFLSSVIMHPRELEVLDFDLGSIVHRTFPAYELNDEEEEEIFIRENGWLKKILINNINWIKVEGVYTHLACKEGLHTLRNTAKCVLKKLPRGLFYQIHKCYYVNRTKVEAINGRSVKIGDNILPIGRTFHKTIMNELSLIN